MFVAVFASLVSGVWIKGIDRGMGELRPLAFALKRWWVLDAGNIVTVDPSVGVPGWFFGFAIVSARG